MKAGSESMKNKEFIDLDEAMEGQAVKWVVRVRSYADYKGSEAAGKLAWQRTKHYKSQE